MRILYLMHVDWRWIKQRPHFIAEQLARRHEVEVLYRVHPRHFSLPASPTRLVTRPMLPLPRRAGRALQRRWIARRLRRFAPDVIWLTSPGLVEILPDELGGAAVVYDCMDDAAAFHADPVRAAEVTRLEDRLCRSAARVLCSSQHLADRLADRSGGAARTVLVRNALSDEWARTVGAARVAPGGPRSACSLGYIGTISEWLDVAALRACLAAVPGLTLHLVGPLAGVPAAALAHPRIVLHGAVAHAELATRTAGCDAFVMPFQVTPLIRGVDPVKLYEYLALDRPVIAVRYPEIERFAGLVHLYASTAELIELVRGVADGTLAAKAPREAIARFLADNTWTARAAVIEQALGELPGRRSP